MDVAYLVVQYSHCSQNQLIIPSSISFPVKMHLSSHLPDLKNCYAHHYAKLTHRMDSAVLIWCQCLLFS